jgi:hypothetical protein
MKARVGRRLSGMTEGLKHKLRKKTVKTVEDE